MKHSLIAAGTLCAFFSCAADSAMAQEDTAAPNKPVKNVNAAAPGVIVPLDPPETLNASQTEKQPVFGNFQYDDERPEQAIDFTLRSMFEDYHTTGPGRASSFLEPGTHWLHDLEMSARQPLGGDLKGEFNAVVRYTDSARHDPSYLSLQRLQFIVSDKVNHLTLGDYYATLSQYSLNQMLKGVGYQRTLNDTTYVRFVAGTLAPRWDHLFGTPHNETIKRDATGLRAQNAGDNYRVGLNLVSAWDHDNPALRTSGDIYRQVLPAVDWEYRSDAGIRFSGEHALANTRRQDTAGVNHDMNGTAHRLNADGNLGKLRWRAYGERVSPDFYTMGGGAALDRLRYYMRGDYRLNRTWSVFLADDWYRDNLDDQLAATTRTHIPEAGVTVRGLFERRNLAFSAALRQRRVKTAAPQYSSQISDRIYLSASDRFKEVSLRGEVEALLNKRQDTTNGKSDNNDFLYRFTVDSRHLFQEGRYDLRPYLNLEHQIVEDPLTGKSVVTHAALLDLRLMAPSNLIYALGFEKRDTDNDVPGADNSHLLRYGVSVEARPSLLNGGTLRAEVGRAHYDFSNQSNNYRESYVRVTMDFPFSLGK